MNHQDYTISEKLVGYLGSNGYTFVETEQPQPAIQRQSEGQSILVRASVAFMLQQPLAAFASGSVPDFKDEQLKASLLSLYDIADLVGINLAWNAVELALVIEADTLSDETLVGRFTLMHDRISSLREYGMTLLRRRKWLGGEVKQGVLANVFLIFRQQYKADHFLNNISDKCKQMAMWKKTWALPRAIDVPGKRVLKWRGWPPRDTIGPQLANHLFS